VNAARLPLTDRLKAAADDAVKRADWKNRRVKRHDGAHPGLAAIGDLYEDSPLRDALMAEGVTPPIAFALDDALRCYCDGDMLDRVRWLGPLHELAKSAWHDARRAGEGLRREASGAGAVTPGGLTSPAEPAPANRGLFDDDAPAPSGAASATARPASWPEPTERSEGGREKPLTPRARPSRPDRGAARRSRTSP
jgi:hypothetical protein